MVGFLTKRRIGKKLHVSFEQSSNERKILIQLPEALGMAIEFINQFLLIKMK